MTALGMGATLALLGVGSLLYSLKLNRAVSIREKEMVISSSPSMIDIQENKLVNEEEIENKRLMKSMKKKAKKVVLYFNENDEMVEEEVALKALKNPKNKGKYHSVMVDFGNEEGTEKITKDIFWGTKRDENAQIFIDNYQKTKSSGRIKKIDSSGYKVDKFENEQSSLVEMKISGGKSEIKDLDKEKVLLDMNPENFEKAQDHLFFDFFSLYAKNFISKGENSKSAVEVLEHR
mmetsp:Transcript_24585/g.24184  ORF Transcript_24585/g.24184 Transcript_24585/m.24184 type:complete len:234 (-) Transcript_24585:55-756(-)|eukprot:CAMPEP_0170556926 /NCGR_PEP_ID=MMETSP0211-20121228/19065_1 /TAXON_ID=311385 /ORGANISM="Pseudokeronopsis sp., Strain OXSARD2" /LENGTH=233 /DNA_ID=CAMNT_0010867551 /DNA_START=51 /DNA_END=752 /DNA_ORIENTATION=-